MLENKSMPNISDVNFLLKEFGVIKPGKGVRHRAEDRLCKMGVNLGFSTYKWYEALNLLNDGRTRFISVIWKKGRAIAVAFQVRRKLGDIDVVTSRKDRQKMICLQADEKYIVNVSERTGKAYFHRATDWGNQNP